MKRLFRYPLAGLWLCLLLQRAPAIRFAAAVGPTLPRVASLLSSGIAAVAALGRVHTLAGATEFVASTEHVTGMVGTPIQPVVFTIIGTPTLVHSFLIVGGELPPGVVVEGAERGVVNAPVVRIAGTPTAAGRYAISFDAYAEFDGTSSTHGTLTIAFTIANLATPTLTPQSTAQPIAGEGFALTAGPPGPSFQWTKNGAPLANATGPVLSLGNVQPAAVGLYTVLATNAAGSVASDPAIVGVTTSSKVIGTGVELQPSDIAHANGNIFDQVLLHGTAVAITADPGQVTRLSFIDLTNDIVQVEFSGPGTLSLVLDGAMGPAFPANYNQPVPYMKGHAGIVIAGATRDTNLSVFSVGRTTAVNPALFRDVAYDGFADLAFIAIASADGEFGALKAANANFFSHRGPTGVYAPGVAFNGPVYVGDISASEMASPVLVLGGARHETWITGGDLQQPNGERVRASGLTRLKFMAGSDSHGRAIPAQANRAVIIQSGRDMTSELVQNPSP